MITDGRSAGTNVGGFSVKRLETQEEAAVRTNVNFSKNTLLQSLQPAFDVCVFC